MKRMRQQIEYLQAELVSARGGIGSDDVQVNVFDKLTLRNALTLRLHNKTSIFRVSEKGYHGLNKQMKTFAGNYMIFGTVLKLIRVNLKCKYVIGSLCMLFDI
jgi:hypothetical protein